MECGIAIIIAKAKEGPISACVPVEAAQHLVSSFTESFEGSMHFTGLSYIVVDGACLNKLVL